MRRLALFAPGGIPEITPGTDLGPLLVNAFHRENITFLDGDILVVTHKIVSKAEGSIRPLVEVSPSARAQELARACGKDPALVQIILEESRSVVRYAPGVLITRHRLGFVCANAGVDQSNAGGTDIAVLLPEDPDGSARHLAEQIFQKTGAHVAVLVSDSHGRPLRNGTIGVAIGCSGMAPIRDYRGEYDRQGRRMTSSTEAAADEVCSAASLLMGQSSESTPVVLLRGLAVRKSPDGVQSLLRSEQQELFIESDSACSHPVA